MYKIKLDGEAVVNRAVKLVTGERPKVSQANVSRRAIDERFKLMKVKKMAVDRIKPDIKGKPPAKITGPILTHRGSNGVLTFGPRDNPDAQVEVVMYQSGFLLNAPEGPEFFFNNRIADAKNKAYLISAWLEAKKRIPKSDKGYEAVGSTGELFLSKAAQYEPDMAGRQKPSRYEMGSTLNRYPKYAGGLIAVEVCENGNLLEVKGPEGTVYEWFEKYHKGDAFKKAELLSKAYTTARRFQPYGNKKRR